MKVKKHSVCQNCRSRKIGCDGKYPGCSQCLLTGRHCPGYPVEWSFIAQSQATLPQRKRQSVEQDQAINYREGAENLSRTLSLQTTPSMRSCQDRAIRPQEESPIDLVSLIITTYVPDDQRRSHGIVSVEPAPRICGSWVEVLPNLNDLTSSHVVSTALTALGHSIASQSSHGQAPSVSSVQSYLTAVQAMQEALTSSNIPPDRDLLAAIMCLGLAELMFPGPSEGLTAHTNAISRILEAHGPARYREGVLHKLFAGFRPLLMIKAIQDRMPSFLHTEDWITIPFETSTPSEVQSLLSQSAMVPRLLRQMDEINSQAINDENISVASQMLSEFNNLLSSLDEWQILAQSHEKRPHYSPRNLDMGLGETSAAHFPRLWFTSITLANALTHVWSLQLICLLEIERLVCTFSLSNTPRVNPFDDSNGGSNLDEARKLMTKICQSMDYLLQDKMKLYGPASAILPLQVAYAVGILDPHGHHVELAVIREIIDRLSQKGLRSFPSHILENNPFVHRWDALLRHYVWNGMPAS